MIDAIAAVIAVAALTAVFYPLFVRKEELETAVQGQNAGLEDLHSRREAVYAAIKDLDFEYQLGNLSQGDYQDLRNEYRQRAATVLREMDEMAAPVPPLPDERPNWDEEIEAAVRRSRRQGAKSPDRPKAPEGVCPGCDLPIGPEDRFCAGCGLALASVCAGCGAGLEPGDVFCSVCGARVPRGRQ